MAAPGSTLRQISERLTELNMGALLVPLDDGGLGVVSERDIATALAEGADPDEVWGDDIMSLDVCVAHPSDSIVHVALQMLDAGVRHLVIREEAKTVGLISIRDVLRPLVDAVLIQGPTGASRR